MVKKTDKLISALALFVTVGFFAAFAVINFIGMEKFVDGDIYADMLVARHMWEQKTLFPEGWIFGNQYYIIATPVFAALFYGICGSMNLSMALATSFMSVCIIISLFYMLRPFVKEERGLLFALLAMTSAVIAPKAMMEATGQLFFTLASYYACYIITLFVVFGDYVRACTETVHRKRVGALVFAMFLSFCTGMQSIRQTLIMVLPIICVELLLTIIRAIKKEKAFRRASFLRCAAYALSNITGYVLMLALKVPNTTIYGSVAANTEGLGEKISELRHAVTTVSGIIYLHGDFSKLAWLHVGLYLLSAAAALVLIVRGIKKNPSGLSVIWILLAAGICGVFSAGLLLNISVRPIYIFMWYPLAAVSVIIVWEALPKRSGDVYIVFLCLISAWNLFFTYGGDVKKAVAPPEAEIVALTDWCAENDIKYIYGQWEAGPMFAAHTDGKVTAVFWEGYMFNIVPYLNEPDVYSEEDNLKAIYLVHFYDDVTAYIFADAAGGELNFIGSYMDYFAYTCTVQLLR